MSELRFSTGWLGRGWIMSLLSLPVAMLSHYCAYMVFVVVLASWRPPAPGEREVACFFPGLVAALVVAVWMGHPLQKSAWLAGALAMVLGSVGCGLVFLVGTGPQWQSTLASYGPYGFIVSLFGAHCLYGSFQSLTGIGLGARLWWQEAGVRDEDSHHE